MLIVLTNSENPYLAFFLDKHQFKPGDTLCNLFSEWDCVDVDEKGRIKINLVHGYPKIYEKKVEVRDTHERIQAR